MREKLLTLNRSQRVDMWRHFKQSNDWRIAERLHAILLLDSGMNAATTLKGWVKAFAPVVKKRCFASTTSVLMVG
jgi:hypothetical protein